jgi:hypothetical protein
MIPANERNKKPHSSIDVFCPNISMPQTKHIDTGMRFCVAVKKRYTGNISIYVNYMQFLLSISL